MVNALIEKTQLGRTADNLLYAIFTFLYVENDTTVKISTEPIFLIDPSTETIDNSGAASKLLSIFAVIGVNAWENLIGTAVRIDFNEERKITSIRNFIGNACLTLIEDD